MIIRGNICIRERMGGKIYLYTHRKGHMTFGILCNAIVRGAEKLADEQYMTRVIFCEMLRGEDLDSVSDFGISTFIGENDLPFFTLDLVNLRVLMEDGRCMATCPCVGYSWAIDEFVGLKEDPRVGWLKMQEEKEKEVKK